MAKTTKPKKETKLENGYALTLICLRQKVSSKGDTVEEALNNLDTKNIKGKGIMQVTHNGVTREKIIMPHMLLRLSAGAGLTRQIIIKNFSTLLK